MTTNTILERATQRPFRKFAIETVGGTWIEVEHEDAILVYTRLLERPRVLIFDPNGRLFILEPDQIATIESR